jgi:hypothetical protein
VDRNDKAFTLLYKVVIHKKVSHPYEIQNTYYYYYLFFYYLFFVRDFFPASDGI